ADHELAVAVVGVGLHDVPQDRAGADGHHGLGAELRLAAQARAQTSGEKHDFHGCSANYSKYCPRSLSMNILWVSPFLPKINASHAGGRALAQWISWTAERHRVTLLCRGEPAERAEAGGLAPHLAGLHLQEFDRPSGPGAIARIAASYARLGRTAN